MEDKKRCGHCKEWKERTNFHKDRRSVEGLQYRCKTCAKTINKMYYENNVEKCLMRSIKWKNDNPEKVRVIQKASKDRNLEKTKLIQKEYRERNSKIRALQSKEWRQQNPEKVQVNYLKWKSLNPDKCRGYDIKRRGTIKGRLNVNIGNEIRTSLRNNKNNRHWESLVGFTIEQLKEHLERQFMVGMSWGNYGQWHIDHKIPISVFNFEKPADLDFRRCWSLENLQPLWSKENRIKHAKLTEPFQPALAMGGI